MRRTHRFGLLLALLILTVACAAEAPPDQEQQEQEEPATMEDEAESPAPPPPPRTSPPPQQTATPPPAKSTPPPAEDDAMEEEPPVQAPPAGTRMVTVEVPAGTILEAELMRRITTEKIELGDKFRARTFDPIMIGGQAVIPAGTVIHGNVTESVSASKMKGQASLTLEFTTIRLPDGQQVPISAVLTEKGKKIGSRTAGIIGGSAAGGAILGRIIGKDTKGAAAGAVLGAAIGTGIASAQDGQELDLPKGTGVAVELSKAIQVQVPAEAS